jgi:antigen flippase
VAKNRQKIFFATELAAASIQVVLAWLLVPRFGLAGAGVAFCGLYVWHTILVYIIVRRLSGFRFSRVSLKTGIIFLMLICGVFAGFFVMPFWPATCVGVAASLLSSCYSLRAILHLTSTQRIPGPIRKLLVRFKFAPPQAPAP